MASFGSLRAPAAASRLPAATTRFAPRTPPSHRAPRPPAQQQHNSLLPCPTAALTEALTTTSSSKTNRRPAVIPQNSPGSARRAAAQRRSSGYDDSYDSAIPMIACPGWERVEEDLGLDEAPGAADPQEWEEMVSLLSFDGEEHKRVTRQAHGANARVEDMFASFDGDDFEAVLRAVRSELPPQPNSKADAAAAAAGQQQQHGAAAKAQPTQSLHESVCALREAAMAAEAARKLQAPALKKRRVPLGQPNPADAWMLQVPTTVAQSDTTSTVSAKPAAAQGTTQQRQPSTRVAPDHQQQQQQRYSLQASRQQLTAASGAPLQLQHTTYIGLSCDSSSDASQDADMPPPAAAAAAAAPTAPRTTSNNIVSISRLGAAVAAACPTVRVLAGAAAAGATTAVLEAAPVPAAAPVQLLSRAAELLTAADEVQAATGVQQKVEAEVGEETAQAEGQQQRWGSRNTQGLRRALARLHHTQQQ